MTDPTGKSFLSYRRTRSDEAELLIQAQHDIGIPTWRDVDDLKHEQTEEELTKVLANSKTANALLWVTDDVADSAVIRKVEIPAIDRRNKASDAFFTVPVAAGGIDYERAAEIMSTHLGLDDFTDWNLEKSVSTSIDGKKAAEVAALVLAARLAAIEDTLGADEPFRLGLFTRDRPPESHELHVALDWQPRFDGRVASASVWGAIFIPSLRLVATALRDRNASRSVVAGGFACLPALVALGAAFLEPRGVHLIWEQIMRNTGVTQRWSLRDSREDCGFDIEVKPSKTDAMDLAVVANVTTDAHPAIRRGQQEDAIPSFRAYVDVSVPDGESELLDTTGKAVDAVMRTADAIGEAKRKYPDAGKLHLFLAAPAGFAVMLGQKLNAIGPVQTYEHVQCDDRIGRYEPAVLLRPGQ